MNITATSASGTKVLASARSLKNLVKRLDRDAQFWRDMGWENFILGGFNPGDAKAALCNREITMEQYRTLLSLGN